MVNGRGGDDIAKSRCDDVDFVVEPKGDEPNRIEPCILSVGPKFATGNLANLRAKFAPRGISFVVFTLLV